MHSVMQMQNFILVKLDSVKFEDVILLKYVEITKCLYFSYNKRDVTVLYIYRAYV